MGTNDYLNKIKACIIANDKDELKILKWLITYCTSLFVKSNEFDNYELKAESKNYFETFKKSMLDAFSSLNIAISNSSNTNTTDYDYACSILTYARSCPSLYSSEYRILLFVYTLSIDSMKHTYSNSNHLSIAISNYTKNYQMSDEDFFNGITFADNLIFSLYLWLADICIISKYNHTIDTARKYLKDGDPVSSYYINPILFSEICLMPSKSDYYYLNPNQTAKIKATIKNIKTIFDNSLNKYEDTLFSVIPSAITVIFNSLLPTGLSRINLKYFIPSEALLRNVDINGNYILDKKQYLPAKKDTSFLKMLILPRENYNYYNKNKTNMLENGFFKYEFKEFCELFRTLYEGASNRNCNRQVITRYNGWKKEIKVDSVYLKYISSEDVQYYSENISQYFNGSKFVYPDISITDMDSKLQQYIIKALKNHTFNFTYSYFQIFCRLIEDSQKYFGEDAGKINIPLSIIHLNSFTKWFDAIMLMNQMPLSYVECEYMFLQKMLLVNPRYRHFICDLSYANLQDILSAQNNHVDLYKNILKKFYKFAYPKFNCKELLNIFKPQNGDYQTQPHFQDINPIYKWIKILDWSIPQNEFDVQFSDDEEWAWESPEFV